MALSKFDVSLVMMSFVALTSVAGCKSTPEDEQKTWNTNQTKIQTLEGKYPTFKPAFENLLTTAKTQFDAAKGNVPAMDVANSQVSSATTIFDTYEKEQARLNALMADKTLADAPASKINPLMDAAKAANAKAQADLKASPANIGEATAKVNDATANVKGAADPLEALKKSMTPAAAPASAATTPPSAKSTTPAAATKK